MRRSLLQVSEIDGDALFDALTKRVSFGGVTGLVEFNDASSHPTRLYDGDRTVGIRYDVRNYGAHPGGLQIVGSWTPCDACTFADRWAPNGVALTYSTSDNARPFDGTEIALLTRLTDERVELGDDASDMACAALLAVRHANERNGRIVPQLEKVRRDFRLSARLADIQTTAKSAVDAYRDAKSAAVDGIVDGGASSTNIFLAQLGSLDRMPQVSYYSSSPALSSAAFTHFGRTYPSDMSAAKTLAGLLDSFGWRYVGVLHVRDAWASAYASHLAQAATSMAVQSSEESSRNVTDGSDADVSSGSGGTSETSRLRVHTTASWREGSGVEVRSAVAQLKASDVSVIVFLSFEIDIGTLLEAADEHGMLREGYVWIAVEGAIFRSISARDAEMRHRLSRVLSFEANPKSARGYTRFQELWNTLTPSDCTVPGVFSPPASLFQRQPEVYAAYAYDAVATLALALASSANPHNDTQVQAPLASHLPPSLAYHLPPLATCLTPGASPKQRRSGGPLD